MGDNDVAVEHTRGEKTTEGGDVGQGGEILRGGLREGLRLDGIESQRRRGRLKLTFFPPTPTYTFSVCKCLGLSVGPPSVVVLVCNPQVS